MDLFQLLKDDHKKAKQQLESILSKEEIDKKAVQAVCSELLIHMEMEETYLYPVTLKKGEDKEITEEAIEEHKEAKKVIEELLSGRLKETKLKVKVEILQLEIEHHVEEEETELFEQIRNALSQSEIEEIGKKMQALKTSRLNEQKQLATHK